MRQSLWGDDRFQPLGDFLNALARAAGAQLRLVGFRDALREGEWLPIFKLDWSTPAASFTSISIRSRITTRRS